MEIGIISKEKLQGCNKRLPLMCERCGDWSLKHNEYYYCNDCYKKRIRCDS